MKTEITVYAYMGIYPSFNIKTKIFSNERVSSMREISLEAVSQTNLESINGNRLLENMSKTIPSPNLGYYKSSVISFNAYSL